MLGVAAKSTPCGPEDHVRFVKTMSFDSRGKFDSRKDDAELNGALADLQQRGAAILELTVKLAGNSGNASGVTALYVIEYEAASPL
jgi:hypothetical protein